MKRTRIAELVEVSLVLLQQGGSMISETRTILALIAFTLGSMAAPVCPGGTQQPAPVLALCLHERAVQLADEGHPAEATANFAKAIGIWNDLGASYDPHRATTMMQMASVLQMEGRSDQAIHAFEQALVLLRRSLGEKHERTAAAMVRLASAYANSGQTAKADPILKAALAPDSGLNQSDRAIALNALGAEAGLRGDYNRAIDYLRQAEVAMGAGNDHDPAYGAVLCNLAAVYLATDHAERAEPLLKKVRAIYTANLGPQHTRMSNLLLQEGSLASHKHRFGEAETLLREATNMAERDLPAASDLLATYRLSLGLAYLENNKLDEADRVLAPALEVKRAVYPSSHRELAVALGRMARLRAAQHRDAEAGQLYREAIDVYERALGPDNDELRLALTEYAQFARSIRDQRLAKNLEKRAKAIHSFRD
jgi:tetratricopeptide (TPR) repeat protein